jgi:molecular chaperone DnaJ
MSVLRAKDRGDLYVEVRVETPVRLTRKQKELLKQFEEAGDPTTSSPESTGFFTRVKEFFDGLKS